MADHTKYKLKAAEELAQVLSGADKLFVIACSKCFKEFETVLESDCDAFEKIAAENGKTLVGSVNIDFLCSQTRTAEMLEELLPAEAENIVVVSCGLGVQTVAEMADIPVYAACDTVTADGHHGMALTDKACGACAQCYLTHTGGICPVVDCSKGLLNGQCGGAKNGKCEVSPDKDCAWEKIQKRLEKQGRLTELTDLGVQLRDYSKVNHAVIQSYVRAIREKRTESFCGGLHPVQAKESTREIAPVVFPEPDTVAINLAQHAGVPADCIVSVGDYVKVGQKVGVISAPISANLHASVSGRVIAVEDRPHATRGGVSCHVVIENDRQYTLHESVKPNKSLEELTGEEILEIVREAGIVGMGGAGFPMHVKLNPGKSIDTVLLNGCECEPMLTADQWVMREYADDVIFGLRAMMKTLRAPKGIIVIEDNKPECIALMREKTEGIEGIEVCAVKTKYPQGGEKVLLQTVLGRRIPRGGIPADVGCMVANVSTARAISDAIQRGMPVTERIVTVTGRRVKNPGNYIVRIGTNIRRLIEYCGVSGDESYIVKVGGPMMGLIQNTEDVATTKCSNGITLCDADPAQPQPCIRCGRCVDVCPMKLQPLHFFHCAAEENWTGMIQQHVTECMECRCCENICASRLPLVSVIRMGKAHAGRVN